LPLAPIAEAQVLLIDPGQTVDDAVNLYGGELVSRIDQAHLAHEAKVIELVQKGDSIGSGSNNDVLTPESGEFYSTAHGVGLKIADPSALERELLLRPVQSRMQTERDASELKRVISQSPSLIRLNGAVYNSAGVNTTKILRTSDGDDSQTSSTIPVAVLSTQTPQIPSVLGNLQQDELSSGLSVARRAVITVDELAGERLHLESDHGAAPHFDKAHEILREELQTVFPSSNVGAAAMLTNESTFDYLIRVTTANSKVFDYTPIDPANEYPSSVFLNQTGQLQVSESFNLDINGIKLFEYAFAYIDPNVWRALEFSPEKRYKVLNDLCHHTRAALSHDFEFTSDYTDFVVNTMLANERDIEVKAKAIELLGLVGSWDRINEYLDRPNTTSKEREKFYYALTQRTLSLDQQQDLFLRMDRNNELRNGFGYELIVAFEQDDPAILMPEVTQALEDNRQKYEKALQRFTEIITNGGNLSEIIEILRECPYSVTPKLLRDKKLGNGIKIGFETEIATFLRDPVFVGYADKALAGIWPGLNRTKMSGRGGYEIRTARDNLEFDDAHLSRSLSIIEKIGAVSSAFGTVHIHIPHNLDRAFEVIRAFGQTFLKNNSDDACKGNTYECRTFGMPFTGWYYNKMFNSAEYLDGSVWASMMVAASALGEDFLAAGNIDPDIHTKLDLKYDVNDPHGYITLLSYLRLVNNPAYLFSIAHGIFNHPSSLRGIDYDIGLYSLVGGKGYLETLPLFVDMVKKDLIAEDCSSKLDSIVTNEKFNIEIGKQVVNDFLQSGRNDLVFVFLSRWKIILPSADLEDFIDRIFLRLDIDKVIAESVLDPKLSTRNVFVFGSELREISQGRISDLEFVQKLLALQVKSADEKHRRIALIVSSFSNEWEKNPTKSNEFLAQFDLRERVEMLYEYFYISELQSTDKIPTENAIRLLSIEIALLPDITGVDKINETIQELLVKGSLPEIIRDGLLTWSFNTCTNSEVRNHIISRVLLSSGNHNLIFKQFRSQFLNILIGNPVENYVDEYMNFIAPLELSLQEAEVLKEVIRKRFDFANSDQVVGSGVWYADVIKFDPNKDYNTEEMVESFYDISKKAKSSLKAVFFDRVFQLIQSPLLKDEFISAVASKIYADGDVEFFGYLLNRRSQHIANLSPLLNNWIFDGDVVKDRALLKNVVRYFPLISASLAMRTFEVLTKSGDYIDETLALCRGLEIFRYKLGDYERFDEVVEWLKKTQVPESNKAQDLLLEIVSELAYKKDFWLSGERSNVIDIYMMNSGDTLVTVINLIAQNKYLFPHYKDKFAQAFDARLANPETEISFNFMEAFIFGKFPLSRYTEMIERLGKREMNSGVRSLLFWIASAGKLSDEQVRHIYTIILEGGDVIDSYRLKMITLSDTLFLENYNECFKMAIENIEFSKRERRPPELAEAFFSKLFSDEIAAKLSADDYKRLLFPGNIPVDVKMKICFAILGKEPNLASLKLTAKTLGYRSEPMFPIILTGIIDKFEPEDIYDFLKDWLTHPGAKVEDTFSLLSQFLHSEGKDMFGVPNKLEKWGFASILPEMRAFVEHNIDSSSDFLPLVIRYMIDLGRFKPEIHSNISEFVNFVFKNGNSPEIVNEVAYMISNDSSYSVEFAREIVRMAQNDLQLKRRINWSTLGMAVINTCPDAAEILSPILSSVRESSFLIGYLEIVSEQRQKALQAV